MQLGRTRWLWMAAVVGLAGCRAVGTGSLSLHPRPGLSQSPFDLEEFVAEHNRNAEAIQSLEAEPSIVAYMARRPPVHADGKMALERPRSFELALSHWNDEKANIGSNDEEFWYWVASSDQPYIYWCRYDELESSALPVTYQPAWIIDALGLEPITPEEAGAIRVRNGTARGTTVLSFPPIRGRGEPYLREMVVSNTDRRVQRLLIYSESPRTLIAEAVPSSYSAPRDPTAASRLNCYLPQKLKLEWKREQLTLDVTLKDVKVNQFDHARSAILFTEPQREGYKRQNLAALSSGSRPESRTRTRQTLAPPDSGDSIRLGRPAPLADPDQVVPGVGRRTTTRPPRPVEEKPLLTLDELVGAPAARPPNSGPVGPMSFSSAPGLDSTIER